MNIILFYQPPNFGGIGKYSSSSECGMGQLFKTNPLKPSPDPTKPIIDTWQGKVMTMRELRALYTGKH